MATGAIAQKPPSVRPCRPDGKRPRHCEAKFRANKTASHRWHEAWRSKDKHFQQLTAVTHPYQCTLRCIFMPFICFCRFSVFFLVEFSAIFLLLFCCFSGSLLWQCGDHRRNGPRLGQASLFQRRCVHSYHSGDNTYRYTPRLPHPERSSPKHLQKVQPNTSGVGGRDHLSPAQRTTGTPRSTGGCSGPRSWPQTGSGGRTASRTCHTSRSASTEGPGRSIKRTTAGITK